MSGLYYALVGVYNDLGYLARLVRNFIWRALALDGGYVWQVLDMLGYHVWRALMAIAWRIDLWFVYLHTYAFTKAARLDRKMTHNNRHYRQ